MYALYAPIQATYKESQSLKGFAKIKFNKEHKHFLKKENPAKTVFYIVEKSGIYICQIKCVN